METSDADSLAKYVPNDGLFFYLEFQGTDAHSGAWGQSSASSILTDTKTGAMLTSILTQLAEGGLTGLPDRKLTGADVSELVTHALQSGFVLAAGGDQPGRGVFVVRDAFDAKIRPAFGRFLATSGMAKKGMKTVAKSGRNLVPFPQNAKGAWWIEGGKDLVVAGDYQLVLDVLDGKKPNAVNHERRIELLQPEAGFEPMLIAFVQPPKGVEIPQLDQAGLSGIRALDLRWGPEGQRLKSVIRVQAPSPRKGVLALMDQPMFRLDQIPPMPAGTKEFMVMSIDLARIYDQVKNLAALAPGGQGTQAFSALEQMVQTELEKDLRDDFLAQIGPGVVFYTVPEDSEEADEKPAARGPLGGIQIPQFVVKAQIKNHKKFLVTLNETMTYVNEKLDPPEEDDSKDKKSGGQKKAKTPRAKFRTLSPDPLTYMLSLPPSLSSVIPIRPTILLGEKYLILAASPDLARAALALEDKKDGLWSPDDAGIQGVLDGLPESLLMVRVSDPSNVLPQDLVSLPDSIQSFISSIVAASRPPSTMNGNQPGFSNPGGQPGFSNPGGFSPGPGQPGGSSPSPDSPPPGGGSPDLNAGAGSGVSGIQTQGGLTGTTVQVQGGNPGNGGQPQPNGPGGPGKTQAPRKSPLANVRIVVPPDQRPDAAKVRTYIQPGCLAVTVDKDNLTIIQRESFPNLGSFTKGMALGASMSLPAMQAARKAAGGAPGPGGVKPGVPGGFTPR